MGDGNYRRTLIRTITFLGGIYFFFEFILPASVLESIGIAPYHTNISTGFIVVGSMAIGLGIINLFLVHGTRVVFQRKDWLFSTVLLFGLILMMSVTMADWMSGRELVNKANTLSTLRDFSQVIISDAEENTEGVPEKSFRITKLHEAAGERVHSAKKDVDAIKEELFVYYDEIEKKLFNLSYTEFIALEEGIKSTSLDELKNSDEALSKFGQQLSLAGVAYQKLLRHRYDVSSIKKSSSFLYDGLYVSLGSAMFSLLGVYIAAAAYRAFRVKSMESLLMMTAATVVMLGQITFFAGSSFTLPFTELNFTLPEVRQWLLEIPNSAAFRAIKIGAAIAGLVMAFRMWFSIESEEFSPAGKGK